LSESTESSPASKWRLDVHPVVFPVSALTILVFVILCAIWPADFEKWANYFQQQLVGNLSWFYILSMTGFLIFVLVLAFSRFGKIKLGPDDSTPDFSLPTWFAMLFSAGMGIGLLFFSVAEPIIHYVEPPVGRGLDLDSARRAMGLTFFHWGLHPWAVYAIVGLSLAYFGFRHNQPLSIRSAFLPLFGDRIHGRIGDVIDILAVVSTMFGVATSLGLGAMQVNSGLNYVAGVPESIGSQLVIIGVITAMATLSVVSGLDVGIRRLSELNMGVAVLLLLFVLICGPTFFLLNAFVENLGSYLQHLPINSFWTGSFDEPSRREWLSGWTVFYWAWWISWSPFVGMFIARISRGRTIREFIAAVFLGPTLAGFAWLTVFGSTALYYEKEVAEQGHPDEPLAIAGVSSTAASITSISSVIYRESKADDGTVARKYDSTQLPKALFVLLSYFRFSGVTAFLATICIVLFFVTSSDSASLVIDTIASGGKEDPPVPQRIYWAVKEGVVAILLLLAGGLSALQTAAITTALPFCVVIILMCVSLWKGLKADPGASPG